MIVKHLEILEFLMLIFLWYSNSLLSKYHPFAVEMANIAKSHMLSISSQSFLVSGNVFLLHSQLLSSTVWRHFHFSSVTLIVGFSYILLQSVDPNKFVDLLLCLGWSDKKELKIWKKNIYIILIFANRKHNQNKMLFIFTFLKK